MACVKKNNMKVAVIQHPPKYLNLTKSMNLLLSLFKQKRLKTNCVPDAWFPGTIVWRLKPGAEMSLTDDLFKISQAKFN